MLKLRIFAVFHYSSIPVSILVSNILCEPLKRQGMAESLGFCQIVGRPADGGELEPLSPLVVEKRNLLIVGPAHPAAGHDIGHCADIRIVDIVMRRNGDLLLFFGIARDISEHSVAAGGDSGNAAIGEQGRSPEARSYIRALDHVRR